MGAVIIVIAMVLVLPIALFVGGALWSALLGSALAAEGLPVSQVVAEPVVVGQFGVTIMKNAPHPNAARLLAGFLATPEGKAARLKATSQAELM